MNIPFEHKVVQGDSIVSLAFRYGFLPETIWNHPDNRKLRTLRRDMNILMPGDVVTIPDKQVKEVPRPVDQKHVFQRKGMLVLYRLQVFDFEEPRACQNYTLVIDDALTFQGTTDKTGTLEHYVPPNAQKGELVIGEDQSQLNIRFGYLDPIEETSGLQKRLMNLGFYDGEAHGKFDDKTSEALAMFQRRFGLTVTGTRDDDTLSKLEGMHDMISEFPADPEAPDSPAETDV